MVVKNSNSSGGCELCGDEVPALGLNNGLCNRCNFLVSITKYSPDLFKTALTMLAGGRQGMRDYKAWADSLKNFEWLPKEIPGASDLDQIIHASSRGKDSFLVFESKPSGIAVPTGQRILFEGLRKLPGMEVVVVHGPKLDGGEPMYFLSGDWQGTLTRDELADRTLEWWYEKKNKKRLARV